MEDRYGALPDATVYLLEAASLRLECERIGIAQIDRKRAELHIRFTENAAIDPQHLMRLVARNAKRGAQFTPQGVLKFPLGRHAARRSSAGNSRTDQHPGPITVNAEPSISMIAPEHRRSAIEGLRLFAQYEMRSANEQITRPSCPWSQHVYLCPCREPPPHSSNFSTSPTSTSTRSTFPISPRSGTLVGYHQYDTQLEDYSHQKHRCLDRRPASTSSGALQSFPRPASTRPRAATARWSSTTSAPRCSRSTPSAPGRRTPTSTPAASPTARSR